MWWIIRHEWTSICKLHGRTTSGSYCCWEDSYKMFSPVWIPAGFTRPSFSRSIRWKQVWISFGQKHWKTKRCSQAKGLEKHFLGFFMDGFCSLQTAVWWPFLRMKSGHFEGHLLESEGDPDFDKYCTDIGLAALLWSCLTIHQQSKQNPKTIHI